MSARNLAAFAFAVAVVAPVAAASASSASAATTPAASGATIASTDQSLAISVAPKIRINAENMEEISPLNPSSKLNFTNVTSTAVALHTGDKFQWKAVANSNGAAQAAAIFRSTDGVSLTKTQGLFFTDQAALGKWTISPMTANPTSYKPYMNTVTTDVRLGSVNYISYINTKNGPRLTLSAYKWSQAMHKYAPYNYSGARLQKLNRATGAWTNYKTFDLTKGFAVSTDKAYSGNKFRLVTDDAKLVWGNTSNSLAVN